MKKRLGNRIQVLLQIFRLPSDVRKEYREIREAAVVEAWKRVIIEVPLERCTDEQRALIVRIKREIFAYQRQLRDAEKSDNLVKPHYLHIALLGRELCQLVSPDWIGVYDDILGAQEP